MEFKDKLQQLRKQKNLTQEELAEALFVSRTAISKWESGRGYPSIDSLKAISKLFSVSIDDLLSNKELLSIAETSCQDKARVLRNLFFGLLDCLAVTLFLLPIFGQKGEVMILSVSMFSLTDTPFFLRATYIIITSGTVFWGVAELALQNYQNQRWLQVKLAISLLLSIIGTLIFIASGQPYASTLVFFMLILKGVLILKQR